MHRLPADLLCSMLIYTQPVLHRSKPPCTKQRFSMSCHYAARCYLQHTGICCIAPIACMNVCVYEPCGRCPGVILYVRPQGHEDLSMTKRIHPNTRSALATQGTMVPSSRVWEALLRCCAQVMFVMTFEACVGPLPKEGRLHCCRSCFSLHTHDRRIHARS
jgi:hypothetical protein